MASHDPVDVGTTDRFRFAYGAPVIRCGRHTVRALGAELAAGGFERALVVCGETVGSTPAVIEPVREGLGERLAGVFAETTPKKRLSTAVDGLAALEETGADVIVAVGGGSSLDTGKIIGVLAARGTAAVDDGAGRASREDAIADVGEEFEETGTIQVPDVGVVPTVAVPTTLAGADISQGAGVTAAPAGGLVGSETGGGVSNPQLMPAATVVDPSLLETTPERVLAASAMNGFDKGIETLYAENATPITDATAARGLTVFQKRLLAFGDGNRDPWVFDALARGAVLVQYGVSRPEGTTLSLIHAFGHGLTRTGNLQQGAAHAIIAPHALEFLFDQVHGRRNLLADALDAEDSDDPAGAVIDAVTEVRDGLDLPGRLRDVDGPGREAFSAVAEAILADPFMANAPGGLAPTVGDIESVLEAAW